MNRFEPLRQLIVARLREFVREPASIFWVYGFPLIMMITLGMAFRSQPVEQARAILSPSPMAEAIRSSLDQSGRFTCAIKEMDEGLVDLRTGRADLIVALHAEEGTSDELIGSQLDAAAIGRLEFLYDDTRPGSVLARDAAENVLQQAAGRVDPLSTSDKIVTEPGSRYVDFLVPGLIGMSLMGGGMWGVGFAIVDMRIRKLLKRFVATPMRRSDFLIGMMVSRLLFLIPEFVILLIVAYAAFGVQSAGGYALVALLILLGAVQFSGIGLLVASRASTIETISGLMNLVMLPMWIFGGIFFSSDRFPEVMQPLIAALPLTPLITALRAVMLEGANLIQILPQVAIMMTWATVTFVLALSLFRWK